MSVKYQQGDVLLAAVPEEEVTNHRDRYAVRTGNEDKKIILAEGEATGHHHRFEVASLDPGVTVTAFHSKETWIRRRMTTAQFPEYIHIEGGSATLYHEEHNPLTLPPGTYRRSIVREFDHIGGSGRSREVVD
ncbi:MAG: hypothetical protein QGH89_01900 [Candidatus Marinimicrobia bacterium]|jgi:hypothetical protein|nr:hypothetical protein [Candidatus Neomarinimicrobiota bacterium]